MALCTGLTIGVRAGVVVADGEEEEDPPEDEEDPPDDPPPDDPVRRFPDSAAAWSTYFPTVTAPIGIWTFQETGTPIVDRVGDADFVANTTWLWQQTGDPTGRKHIEFDGSTSAEWAAVADTAYGDIPNGSHLSLYIRFKCPDTAANRSLVGKDTGGGSRWSLAILTAGGLRFTVSDGTATSTNLAGPFDTNEWFDCLVSISDTGAGAATLVAVPGFTPATATITSWGGMASIAALRIGSTPSFTVMTGCGISYMALFNAALTSANLTTIVTPV